MAGIGSLVIGSTFIVGGEIVPDAPVPVESGSPWSTNNKNNSYYQKRFHVRLAKDDMTKDEINPQFGSSGDSGGGGPADGFLRVYSDDEQLAYSDDEFAVYIAA